MKKIFFSFLTVVALCCILVGCNYPSTPKLTPTVISTSNVLIQKAATLIPSICEPIGLNIYSNFLATYGDLGCKLPSFSPDDRYLAIVGLLKQENTSANNYTDTIVLLDTNTNDHKVIHSAPDLSYIGKLEWSPSGKLLFWQSTWEGSGTTFVYDPINETIITEIVSSQEYAWLWNPSRSSFYSIQKGGYGKEECVSDLGGYDFSSNTEFPDFKNALFAQQLNSNSLEYELSIEPFAWSQDGKRLWLTITPLKWQGDEIYKYLVEPRRAVVIEFYENSINVSELASDPELDFSFTEPSNPEVISSPYRLEYCPSDN
jgi:hypothetical protein